MGIEPSFRALQARNCREPSRATVLVRAIERRLTGPVRAPRDTDVTREMAGTDESDGRQAARTLVTSKGRV